MVRSVFHYTDSRSFGGAEQALLILIENLDRRAWESTLLCGDTAVSPLQLRARELGATVQSVPEIPYGLDGARYVPGLARELRQARPAVFHAHLSWPFAAKYGLIAALLARIPAVVHSPTLPRLPFPSVDHLPGAPDRGQSGPLYRRVT